MSIDLTKDLKHLYRPGADEFVEVDAPRALPGGRRPRRPEHLTDYVRAVEALYTAGYGIRAAFKARTGSAFIVGPLEGLWSSDGPASFVARDKGRWDWTMLIPLPDQITSEDATAGLQTAARKAPDLPVPGVRRLTEGRCLQILHVGSYDDEGPKLARLHTEVRPRLGLTWNGAHHEIYLRDPRRTAAARLRAVLRQPVRPTG